MYLTYKYSQPEQIDILKTYTALLNDTILPDKQNPDIFITLKYNAPQFIRNNKGNYIITNAKQLINTLYDKWYKKFDRDNMQQYYTTFKIPKRTGGYRTINTPKNDLASFMKDMKSLFEDTLHMLPHNAAYAYIKNRCIKQALENHKDNNYFLKLDIKGFFDNCTNTFILEQLKQVYPTNYLLNSDYNAEAYKLEYLLSLTTLNNGLPQGTQLSPTLTNLIMVPLDYFLTDHLTHKTYTRYADDMLISSTEKFDFKHVEKFINNFFKQNTPFQIKTEKTRYGSNKGRNWNLGLMINKDHQITLGYKKKQRFKITLNNFLNDCLTKNIKWDKIDAQQLLGEISYFKSIEPEYTNYLLERYNTKYNADITSLLITIIKDIPLRT